MIPSGAQGYAEIAQAMARADSQYELTDLHPALVLPQAPCRVLDVGAGTGRDAGYLAQRGFQVTALEPVAELRALGQKTYPDSIHWISDALPGMSEVRGSFALILITAVWMHLAPEERVPAMARVAALLDPGGQLALTLRHGPVPAGRLMFPVDADETIALAQAQGLRLTHRAKAGSLQAHNRAAGVVWTRLIFDQAPRQIQPPPRMRVPSVS